MQIIKEENLEELIKISRKIGTTDKWNPEIIEEARAGLISAKIIMDREFNVAMKRDIKRLIADAFVCLTYNSEIMGEEEQERFIQKKAHQMKEELCKFIDAQAKVLKG